MDALSPQVPRTAVRATHSVRDRLNDLKGENRRAYLGLMAAKHILEEFGPKAGIPEVKWRIEAADYPHRANMGELRWPDPDNQEEHPTDAWRVLFYSNRASTYVLLVAVGNKHDNPTWYEDQIRDLNPLLDKIKRHVEEGDR